MLLASFMVENSVFYRRKQKLNTGLNPDLQSRIRLTSRELKVIYFLVFMWNCYQMASQQPVVQSSCASKSYSGSLYIMTIWGRFETADCFVKDEDSTVCIFLFWWQDVNSRKTSVKLCFYKDLVSSVVYTNLPWMLDLVRFSVVYITLGYMVVYLLLLFILLLDNVVVAVSFH